MKESDPKGSMFAALIRYIVVVDVDDDDDDAKYKQTIHIWFSFPSVPFTCE